MYHPIRSRELANSMQRIFSKVSAAKVVDANCEKASEVCVGYAGWGLVPVNHGRVVKLSRESGRPVRLKLAIYREGRKVHDIPQEASLNRV